MRKIIIYLIFSFCLSNTEHNYAFTLHSAESFFGSSASEKRIKTESWYTKRLLGHFSTFLQAYRKEYSKWPQSWEEFEKNYGQIPWESEGQHQSAISCFTFLPQIKGTINSNNKITVLLIQTNPSDHVIAGDKFEYGRWAMIERPDKTIATYWYAESQLEKFTAWSEIKRCIDGRHQTYTNEAYLAEIKKFTASSSDKEEITTFNFIKAHIKARPFLGVMALLLFLLIFICIWILKRKSMQVSE